MDTAITTYNIYFYYSYYLFIIIIVITGIYYNMLEYTP